VPDLRRGSRGAPAGRPTIRITLACLIALAAPAAAQMTMPTEAPGKPDPRIATPGRYKFDPDHSQILFTVTHLGWTNYTGEFRRPSGRLTLDVAHPSASTLSVSVPIDTVQTTVSELDTSLRGTEFFDAGRFPTATFVSTRVVPTGPATADVTGTLSLHGVTRPVILAVQFIGAGRQFWGEKKMAIGFAATGRISRSAFGIDASPGLVSDTVDLVINAGLEAE
jgi:polyisoprenoid-binding protein YceI